MDQFHVEDVPAELSMHPQANNVTLSRQVSVGGVMGRVKVFVRPRPLDQDALQARGGLAIQTGGEERDEITVHAPAIRASADF